MKKFIIIDGNALLHRAWHAIPLLTTKSGILINAAYGFTSIFLKIISEQKPDYICATFDMRAPTFRHEKYKEYKAQRVKQPDELYSQISIIKEMLEAFDVPIYEKSGFEADDVIGTISHSLKDKKDLEIFILTGDLDTLQLVNKNTKILTFRKGINDIVIYDIEAVKERFSLSPEQMIDYKALRGDPSDNIPGVSGIGEKTAILLITKFRDIDNMYKNLDKSDLKDNLKNKLKDEKEKAYLSKELSIIDKNVNIDFDFDKNSWDYDSKNDIEKKVFDVFQKYEFRSLLSKIPKKSKGVENNFLNIEFVKDNKNLKNYKLINNIPDFNIFYKELIKYDKFCIDTETTSINVYDAKLLGISFCFKEGHAYYVNAKKEFLEKLKPILKKSKLIGHNIKYDYKILKLHGFEIEDLYFDTLVSAYLLSTTERSLKLDDLVFSELGYRMQPIQDLIGKKGKDQLNMGSVDIEKVSYYSCEDVDYTFRLYKKYEKELEKQKFTDLFEKLEMPLTKILSDMELEGIEIDVKFLREFGVILKKRIIQLTKKIYKCCGEEFNIASPLQLKEILFEKLQISSKGLKKGKTGISTAASELEKMRGLHPVIDLIFEYRELSKLQSTYVESLIKQVDLKNRIHTNFNQAVTATGRLSSSDPNLQNIPIRTELGKEIRRAFVAKKGYKLLCADYSQIELRVIASLSNDEKMIKSFNNNEDIHARTAAEIFGKPIDNVSSQDRRKAKEVNFGVIYGLGARGLAQRTEMNFQEAKDFITKYFELYKNVKKYLDKTKEYAHDKGYVQTLFGRRRYISEINSSVPMIRAASERVAINMPVQGTAADLMKMALIRIYAELPKISKKSKMLLQVHDEVVIEVPNDDIEKVAKKVEYIMEDIFKLKVPIRVDVSLGKNWGECK
ncbi:MAG: DNA polymerase I [Patescibacteria group bacterium]|nr:DNA polymerase I [Patescibacteria group bacterium]MDD4303872.1 DNA polymerase I [Patescibacteria group bacterium]MDD4695141.1 DNA polymerase I [Patescibacteria group bacterium]